MFFIYLIPIILIVLYFVSRSFIRKVWEIKKTPSEKTPASIGLDYSDITIEKENGTFLYGWWIDHKPSDTVLVFQHGWGRNAERMLQYMIPFKDSDFHMLAFDFTGHGSSDNDEFPNIYKFSRDLLTVMDHMEKVTGRSLKFILVGHSAGGAASVIAAGEDARIKKVITLGAPSHPYDIMSYEFKRRKVPKIISIFLLKLIENRIGRKFDSFAPSNLIERSKAEFLIIQGTDDSVVPLVQAEKLIKKADPEKTDLWIMNGIRHGNFPDYPGFARRLNEFVRK